MALFIEHGYDAVTVADIAKQAGLTKRSFFNHFADKREVMFAAADAFEARVLDALGRADPELEPLDAAVWAYSKAAEPLGDYPDLARARGALIESSAELQERNLMKMASMTAKVAELLGARGASPREAAFVSQAATTIFTTAVDDWVQQPEHGLDAAIRNALSEFRSALGAAV